MKKAKLLLPLTGATLLLAMVAQMKFFQADAAMGSLESLKATARSWRGSTGAAGVPAEDVSRIHAEGRVTTYPGAQVVVGTDVAGTLVRLLVDEKSRVERGQVIGEIRSEDVREALNLARSRIQESVADIRLYEVELARATRLYQETVGTRQAVDRAQRDLDSAQARREVAQAEVRRLEAVLDKSLIRAPIRGTVLQRMAQPGEALREQAPVVSIADLAQARIEAEVDEFDAGRVALGAEVLVRAEGFDDQQWRGRVEEIPDSVVPRRLKPEDPGRPTDTRVLLVKVKLLEATPLKLGQRVELEIKRK